MKAMILAAGLGTRLRPWTLSHPKALVPVDGVPMLQRVILRLKDFGFDDITVNVHHFADQIVDFLNSNDFGVKISISDESERLLDTGGGLLAAEKYLLDSPEPVLIHNVDIISNAPLSELMGNHVDLGRDVTLLTSHRDSQRRLIFDMNGTLKAWHNLATGEYRPADYSPCQADIDTAFSGIYVVGPRVFGALRNYSDRIGDEAFPIMPFFLSHPEGISIGNVEFAGLKMLDIGKPAALENASSMLRQF